jgi:hypothetical protein
VPDDMLSEVEQDALSTAVQTAAAYLEERRQHYHTDAWPRELRRLRSIGRELIEAGAVWYQARGLTFSTPLAEGLAALSMLDGGVKVAGIVFCARHYPAGDATSTLYGCRRCDPGTTSNGDHRTVISAEGGEYL